MDRQIDRRDGFKRSSTCHLFDIIIVSLLLLSLSFLLLLSLSILLLLLLLLLLFLLLLLSFLSSLSLLFLMLLFVCPIVDLLFDAPPQCRCSPRTALHLSVPVVGGDTFVYKHAIKKKREKATHFTPLYPIIVSLKHFERWLRILLKLRSIVIAWHARPR